MRNRTLIHLLILLGASGSFPFQIFVFSDAYHTSSTMHAERLLSDRNDTDYTLQSFRWSPTSNASSALNNETAGSYVSRVTQHKKAPPSTSHESIDNGTNSMGIQAIVGLIIASLGLTVIIGLIWRHKRKALVSSRLLSVGSKPFVDELDIEFLDPQPLRRHSIDENQIPTLSLASTSCRENNSISTITIDMQDSVWEKGPFQEIVVSNSAHDETKADSRKRLHSPSSSVGSGVNVSFLQRIKPKGCHRSVQEVAL